MTTRLRIAIVGCGIAGAALAAHLGRRGHGVEAFERGTGSEGGAGLLLAPPALHLLRAIGLEDEARARGAIVSGLRGTQARGGTLFDWDSRRWGRDCRGLGIERRVLHAMLMRAAAATSTVHHGLGVDGVDPGQGWITDSRGDRRGPYDVVVASDGAGSRLRAGQPGLVTRMHRYRWTAMSCLMQRAADANPRTALEQAFRGAHHVSSWPVGPVTESGQAVCVSVNVPTASVPRFAKPGGGVEELLRLELASAAWLESLRAAGPWIPLSCRDVALRRYYRQRLVFLGDAAHSLSPQLGQGARLALAGAASLAAALERHPVAAALAEYERSQRALAARYQRLSRWLTPVFQSQRSGALWLRDRIVPSLARLAPVEQGLMRLLCGPLA